MAPVIIMNVAIDNRMPDTADFAWKCSLFMIHCSFVSKSWYSFTTAVSHHQHSFWENGSIHSIVSRPMRRRISLLCRVDEAIHCRWLIRHCAGMERSVSNFTNQFPFQSQERCQSNKHQYEMPHNPILRT